MVISSEILSMNHMNPFIPGVITYKYILIIGHYKKKQGTNCLSHSLPT